MNKKNILLVEDDAIIGMYEKSLLEQEGYNVVHCNSGEKAIEYNNSTNFDLILMDIDLGKGINGVEAAEIILRNRHIPIVFISSHNEKEIIEQTESINSYGYIVKNSPERVIFTVIKMAFKLFESNKRIQDSLRETRKKEILLESIFTSIPDYIGILTPDFKILKSNKDFYEFLGINKENISGDHYYDLFNKPKIEQKDSFFQEFTKTKGIYKQEIYKENIDKYFDIMLYPIIEEDGSIINFVEHIRDITIARKTEEQIKEKKDLLSITLKSIGDAVISTDLNGRIKLMNKTAEKLTGWSFEEVKDRNIDEIFKIYDAENFLEIKPINHLIESKKEKFEFSNNIFLRDKNNNEYAIADSIAFIKDSEGIKKGFIIVFSNITERYNLIKELKTKETFITTILNNNANIMLYQVKTNINDKDKREFIFLTGAVKKFYNTTEDKIKENHLLIYDKIFEEDKNRLREEEEKAIANNSVFITEIRVYNSDNSIRWSKIISVPVKISETETLWNGIEIDITEERNNRDKLNYTIKENEIILKEVHHRIKNNMNIVLTLLKMQQEKYKDEIIKSVLNDASSRITSMMILYDKLYSSKNKKELWSREYLSSLIDGIIEIFPKKIELKIEKNIDDFLISDKTLSIIGIILNEFLTNSMKHAFLNRERGVILFTLSKSNGNIVMIFKDDGIGMKNNFDFEKSDGFGVKLITLLVNQLNGTISLNKNNGVEYTVKFTI